MRPERIGDEGRGGRARLTVESAHRTITDDQMQLASRSNRHRPDFPIEHQRGGVATPVPVRRREQIHRLRLDAGREPIQYSDDVERIGRPRVCDSPISQWPSQSTACDDETGGPMVGIADVNDDRRVGLADAQDAIGVAHGRAVARSIGRVDPGDCARYVGSLGSDRDLGACGGKDPVDSLAMVGSADRHDRGADTNDSPDRREPIDRIVDQHRDAGIGTGPAAEQRAGHTVRLRSMAGERRTLTEAVVGRARLRRRRIL